MQFKLQNFLFFFLVSFITFTAQAQLSIPQPSPTAKVMQRVSLTDITIDYSSPGVKGREIWGELIPYGEMWRAGANSPTKITFSENVMIEGSVIPAGTYTLMIVPRDKTWEFILNTDSNDRGVFGYDETEDILRFSVNPEKTKDFQERLAYYISAGDNVTATITLRWENIKASFNVKTDNVEKAQKSVASTTGRMWFDLAQSARFNVENGLDLDQALVWAKQSTTMREHFYGYWVKAMVLEAQGSTAEALTAAQKAKEIGDAEPSSFYEAYQNIIVEKITAWSN